MLDNNHHKKCTTAPTCPVNLLNLPGHANSGLIHAALSLFPLYTSPPQNNTSEPACPKQHNTSASCLSKICRTWDGKKGNREHH